MSAEMARLQALCKELGLEDLVVFLGKRAQETLPYYYSAAEIVIMPSHYESFGMVALEAMACGTPVVASQVGGLGIPGAGRHHRLRGAGGRPGNTGKDARKTDEGSGPARQAGRPGGRIRQILLVGQDRRAREKCLRGNAREKRGLRELEDARANEHAERQPDRA